MMRPPIHYGAPDMPAPRCANSLCNDVPDLAQNRSRCSRHDRENDQYRSERANPGWSSLLGQIRTQILWSAGRKGSARDLVTGRRAVAYPPSCCNGTAHRRTHAAWLAQILRVSPFTYRAVPHPNQQDYPYLFAIRRDRASLGLASVLAGQAWWCDCGGWITDDDPKVAAPNPPLMLRSFAAGSEADRVAERLNKGLPAQIPWIVFLAFALIEVSDEMSPAIPALVRFLGWLFELLITIAAIAAERG